MLDERMHWTNADFGNINAAFQAAYAVGLLGFGWFVDRYGVRIGYATSIVTWSIAAGAHALVTTATGFMGARVFLGLCEAGNFPSGIKAVAQWFPRTERALATTVFNCGANVGGRARAGAGAVAGDNLVVAGTVSGGGRGGHHLDAAVVDFLPRPARTLRGVGIGTGVDRERPGADRGGGRPRGLADAAAPAANVVVRRRQTAHRPGVVFPAGVAARLLQEGARPGHQVELAAAGDDLRGHHDLQPRGQLDDGPFRPARPGATTGRARRASCVSRPCRCAC